MTPFQQGAEADVEPLVHDLLLRLARRPTSGTTALWLDRP